MKKVVVLAMHGAPPRDFPSNEMAEMFSLHSRLEHGGASPGAKQRYAELEEKMRHWPRSAANDPFYTASLELAEALSKELGLEVQTGFNEFCAPGLAETLAQAADGGANEIFVVTPMMTRGGEHAEGDIARAVVIFRWMHPDIRITYAWPFETTEVTRFLAGHISRFAQ